MFQKFLSYLSKIINKFIKQDANESENNSQRYFSKQLLSMLSILSRDIANEVMADSEITAVGNDKRAKYLNNQLQGFHKKAAYAVTRMAGTGGVILKPYTTGYDNKIKVDILPQTRFIPETIIGDTVTAGYFLADTAIHNNKEYYRIEHHEISLESKQYTIKQYATHDGKTADITSIPEWAKIPPEQVFSGIDRLLFGFLRCPTDDKKETTGWYGVPLDYGSEDLEELIQSQLSRIDNEFIKTESWLGVDKRLFDAEGKIPEGKDKLFKMLTVGGSAKDNFWQEFAPTIREQSLINGFTQYLSLYEKAAGVSSGFFSKAESKGATATEIKFLQRQTFNTVDAIRSVFEIACNDLVYSMDVIANLNGYSTIGEYELAYNWDYSMRESSQERWQQLKDGIQIGTNDVAEARAWSMNEDEQQAQEKIEKIVPLSEVAAGLYSHEEYLATKHQISIAQAKNLLPTTDDLLIETEGVEN